MNNKYPDLYARLLADLRICMESGLADLEKAEKCFKISFAYMRTLKKLLQANGFESEEAEIAFFKVIKPGFTGQMEYYVLVYAFLLFCPKEDILEAVRYLEKEMEKIGRFRCGSSGVIAYMESGRRDRDGVYFLRQNFDPQQGNYRRLFDPCPEFAATWDGVLAQLEGYRLYEMFLRRLLLPEEIKQI